MSKKFLFAVASFVLVVVAFAAAGFSQTSPSKDFPGIKISNFGKMNDSFYRGARPSSKDFPALKAIGINTVIDLTEDSKNEQAAVEAAGMKYINIPIVDKGYPTDENVAAFLKTIDDKDTGVFYVHCAGGRHRTGDMGALYRFTKDGWSYDQVFKEMENYDFYTSGGHEKAKDFVVDYASKIAARRTAAPAVIVSAPIEKTAAPAEKATAPAVRSTTPVGTLTSPMEKVPAPMTQTAPVVTKSTPTVKKFAAVAVSSRHMRTSRRLPNHNA